MLQSGGSSPPVSPSLSEMGLDLNADRAVHDGIGGQAIPPMDDDNVFSNQFTLPDQSGIGDASKEDETMLQQPKPRRKPARRRAKANALRISSSSDDDAPGQDTLSTLEDRQGPPASEPEGSNVPAQRRPFYTPPGVRPLNRTNRATGPDKTTQSTQVQGGSTKAPAKEVVAKKREVLDQGNLLGLRVKRTTDLPPSRRG